MTSEEKNVDKDEKKYYIAKDGEPVGPLSLVNVAAGINRGTFEPHHMCWVEGMEDWSTIEKMLPQLVKKKTPPPIPAVTKPSPPPLREQPPKIETSPYAPPETASKLFQVEISSTFIFVAGVVLAVLFGLGDWAYTSWYGGPEPVSADQQLPAEMLGVLNILLYLGWAVTSSISFIRVWNQFPEDYILGPAWLWMVLQCIPVLGWLVVAVSVVTMSESTDKLREQRHPDWKEYGYPKLLWFLGFGLLAMFAEFYVLVFKGGASSPAPWFISVMTHIYPFVYMLTLAELSSNVFNVLYGDQRRED